MGLAPTAAPTDRATCHRCGKTFATRYVLTAHLRKRHDERKEIARCNICDSGFTQWQALYRHEETAHGGRLTQGTHFTEEDRRCSICTKLLLDRSTLAKHVKKHARCSSP